MLSKINDNLAGINRNTAEIRSSERAAGPGSPAPPPLVGSKTCPSCGLVNPISAKTCDCGFILS
jgi:hypothetical protein